MQPKNMTKKLLITLSIIGASEGENQRRKEKIRNDTKLSENQK